MERPSVLPPLGGCPASCPDTYRLTHDHRHVRNWARLEISVLNWLRKIFFGMNADFPNASLRVILAARAHSAEHEQTLREPNRRLRVSSFCHSVFRSSRFT